MHPDFADWYRVARLDLADVDLKGRWAGIEAFLDAATLANIVDAARLFYGLPTKSADFLTSFREPFKSADDKFSMLDNNAELRVLAGASLVAELDSARWPNLAALLLTCGALRGKAAPLGDVVRLAQEFLDSSASVLRSRDQVRAPSKSSLEGQLSENLAAALTALKTFDPATTAPIGEALRGLTVTVISLGEWAREVEQQVALRREESDVLWWLFGGKSRDSGEPFSQMSVAPASLVAAKEMADLTRTIPAPYSSLAFLDKVVRSAQGRRSASTVTLAAAVDGCPSAWRRKIATDALIDPVVDFCPTSFALRKADEADGDKAWHAIFKGVTGLDPEMKMDPVDLAMQAYSEWLLARAYADAESGTD